MRCVGLRKHSPMWVEVGVELASSPPAMVLSSLGIMAWCLTHPAEIAGFLPSLKRHWHQGWVEADKAEREHERFRLRAERTGMRVHAADPGGVETSEDVPHYEDLELPPFDG